jgi:hypothetical protein
VSVAPTLSEREAGARSDAAGARLFEPTGSGSLDEALERLSQSLLVRGNARCPVCGATLVRDAEGAAPVATCGACGSALE